MKINTGEKTSAQNNLGGTPSQAGISNFGGQATPQDFSQQNQNFGQAAPQNFGTPNQGFGTPNQGFAQPTQGFGQPTQGFGQATQSPLSLEKQAGANGIISLDKSGEGFTLNSDNTLGQLYNYLKLAAGWDVNLFNPTEKFDVDLSVLQCDENHQAITKDLHSLIFHANLIASDGSLRHSGDNKDGKGAGDDEIVETLLKNINPMCHHLYVFITIDKAHQRNQNFGRIQNAFFRILNAEMGDREIMRCDLTSTHPSATGVVFLRISRQGLNGWRVDRIDNEPGNVVAPDPKQDGSGHLGDLRHLLKKFGIYA